MVKVCVVAIILYALFIMVMTVVVVNNSIDADYYNYATVSLTNGEQISGPIRNHGKSIFGKGKYVVFADGDVYYSTKVTLSHSSTL